MSFLRRENRVRRSTGTYLERTAYGRRRKAAGGRASRPGAPAGRITRCALQRAQEVQQVLLLPLVETVEPVDHGVGLGRAELEVPGALVLLDGLQEVVRAAVVEEEDPLAETPQ